MDVRFLLLKTKPERGSFWQPVTGGVESGETLVSAAEREALEETGLRPHSPLLELGDPFEFESRFGPAVEYPFALEVNSSLAQPPHVVLDDREHDQYQWVTFDEALLRLQFESNRKPLRVLQDALKLILSQS